MKPCRMINKIYWIFPAAALALAAAAYPFLPEQLVSYWGMDDGADASWHKAFLFAIPALLAFCAFVFTWLPTRRTSRQNRERFQKEAGILIDIRIVLAVEILIILFWPGICGGWQADCLFMLRRGSGCCGVFSAQTFLPRQESPGRSGPAVRKASPADCPAGMDGRRDSIYDGRTDPRLGRCCSSCCGFGSDAGCAGDRFCSLRPAETVIFLFPGLRFFRNLCIIKTGNVPLVGILVFRERGAVPCIRI